MTEPDPLEEELAAFRPVEPTSELKTRIAERLACSVPMPRTRSWTRLVRNTSIAVAAGLAASLVGVIFWHGNQSATNPAAIDQAVQPSLSAAFDDSQPTLWTYRPALTGSDEGLDKLLDMHGHRTSETIREPTRDNVFVRFDRGTNTFTGEL